MGLLQHLQIGSQEWTTSRDTTGMIVLRTVARAVVVVVAAETVIVTNAVNQAIFLEIAGKL